MRLYSLSGKLVPKNVSKYRIDWDKPCRSQIQFQVKQFFRKYWINKICYEEFPVYGSRMTIDLFCATSLVAVETDGDQHHTFSPFYHNDSRLNFLASMKRDSKKEEFFEKNKIISIRIYENEVKSLSVAFLKDKFNFDLV